jgi:hypothetical protein
MGSGYFNALLRPSRHRRDERAVHREGDGHRARPGREKITITTWC